MESLVNIFPPIFIVFSYLSFAFSKAISLDFPVKEHSEIGLLIVNLLDSYHMRDHSLMHSENLSFQMMKDNPFVLLEAGKLIVKSDIDREQICVKANQCCCINLLVLLMKSNVQTDYLEIRIFIEDINDHAPSWPEPKIILNIPEHTKIGSKYHLPLAKDPDSSPKNSISKYTLKYVNKSQMKIFSIDYNSISQRLSWNQLLIKVDADIDRELIDKVELILIAEDSGTPPLSGSTSLIIAISDINDNSPYFEKPPTEITIKENNKPNQFLCQIIAKDNDVSDVDKLSFSFGYSMSSEEKSKFALNPKNGRLFAKQILDYDLDQNIFNLPIQVTDGSNVAEITLVVKVQNENDNPPTISILPLVNSSNSVLFVEENILDDRIIATLVAEDIDNRSTIVSCTCNTGGFKLLRIDSETSAVTKYTILLIKPLDRETNEFVQAAITCQDNGYPQQTAVKLLKIRVIDKNDCPPRFPGVAVTVYIDEGLPIDTYVTRLNAIDCDAGFNAELVYKTDHTSFTIDDQSGILKTNSVFDREKTEEQKVDITVFDRKNMIDAEPADRVLSSMTTIRILIKDVNDCAPVFKKHFYEFAVSEGSPARTYVGSVLAEDADVEVINRQISYAMVIKPYDKKNYITKMHFTIAPDGRIYTTKDTLDRETCDSYSFSIEAWDSGPVTHRISVDVMVKIDDVNDNYPQWLHASDVGLSLNVTRDETVSRLITVLRATDGDSGVNAVLNYDIVQGNEYEIFRLNQKSGSLYLVKQPVGSTPEIIRLLIKVSDSGKHPLSNTTTVRIYFLPEIAKPFAENRFFEKDLVVMICMITVTLIVSAILVVAIVLLKCKHCYKDSPVQYEAKNYRQGHPDGSDILLEWQFNLLRSLVTMATVWYFIFVRGSLVPSIPLSFFTNVFRKFMDH